ncbi:helix-turn-helix domain-containing protein [Dehalobacter sp. DCM]|uniref:helix-turn-helix domain-containing protein n=1 Tax=Dehalobacter sp. DCM TaxID=2907827 RepID=UPI003081B0C0|nr:helix-turn-helix domain-containing protein [Dehalobacter sp. DCM]UWG96048.1 helix-turn-helix domain-containing protein [Dehalobacter sp. DCM]UWG97060.1 helix-turn-helix domain-containing protein [Dehalobacter sp. DCM]
MPKKRYSIVLTDQERQQLMKTIKCGASPAKAILRANIILLLDESTDKHMSVHEIADVLNTSPTTVIKVKKAFCEKGAGDTISRKKRSKPPVEAKITGDVEAKIIALSCGEPPAGFSRWTLRLLADKSVELDIIDQISYVSVGSILKKRIETTSP